MKPVIIYSDRFLNAVSWVMKVGGISLFPFIILREKYKGTDRGVEVVRHETIHFKQQIETLVVPFYVIYVLNFVFNLLTMNPDPYRNILFEKEAFANEAEELYITNRKPYAWLKLINQ